MIYRLWKLTLSDQAQVTLQLRGGAGLFFTSVQKPIVFAARSSCGEGGGRKTFFHRDPNPLSAALPAGDGWVSAFPPTKMLDWRLKSCTPCHLINTDALNEQSAFETSVFTVSRSAWRNILDLNRHQHLRENWQVARTHAYTRARARTHTQRAFWHIFMQGLKCRAGLQNVRLLV
jgi:hypothetical protein